MTNLTKMINNQRIEIWKLIIEMWNSNMFFNCVVA